MIKRINKIKDFGIFRDFKNRDLPDFLQYNLIYGWNCSGKTTLSRIFRCFETGQKHPDYSTASFELEDGQGNKVTENDLNKNLPIRVFNSDFINENLKWDIAIEPIFLLGQQNIQLQTDLDNEKQKLKAKQIEKTDWEKKKREAEIRIENALTNKARDVGNILSIRPYDKRHFLPKINEVLSDTQNRVLEDEEIQRLIIAYKSIDKKETIQEVTLKLPALAELIKSAANTLATTVKANVIERLKANSELNEWVKEGKELHQGKEICEFCGNKLPSNLLDDLSNHFSHDYETLINDIQNQIRVLSSSKITLSLPDEAKLYSEFQTDYSAKKTNIETEVALLNETIQSLIQYLEAKQLKAFDSLTLPTFTDNTSNIESVTTGVNQIFKQQSKKTEEFEAEKEKALSALLRHYASEFITNEKYSETLKDINDYGTTIQTATQEFKHIETTITSIEQQLSETVKGAEKINEYLGLYFGKDDLKVKVTNDNKFQLLRTGIIAKNLSEGEKTAIAFAYFITKLEDKNTTLADAIVYIDDPVSSLDANHLFNTYSFIKTKLSSCSQLFISTHNFEFFNLIKDWFTGKGMKKDKRSFYMIERTTNSTIDQSAITKVTSLILDFKSEYCYLFSIIYKFRQSPSLDYYQLYNLPNILRRYMESLMSFEIPNGHGLESKLDILIPNNVSSERVRKFVHHYSHSSSVTRSLQFPDLKECTDIVNLVLGAVEIKYKEHYDALVDVMGNSTTVP